jgi:hypothetical protein
MMVLVSKPPREISYNPAGHAALRKRGRSDLIRSIGFSEIYSGTDRAGSSNHVDVTAQTSNYASEVLDITGVGICPRTYARSYRADETHCPRRTPHFPRIYVEKK